MNANKSRLTAYKPSLVVHTPCALRAARGAWPPFLRGRVRSAALDCAPGGRQSQVHNQHERSPCCFFQGPRCVP